MARLHRTDHPFAVWSLLKMTHFEKGPCTTLKDIPDWTMSALSVPPLHVRSSRFFRLECNHEHLFQSEYKRYVDERVTHCHWRVTILFLR